MQYPVAASRPTPFDLHWRHAPERYRGPAPARVDLSAWAGPVRNQGEEGSCSAFSGTGVVELLQAKYRGERVVLSPAALYEEERILLGDPTQDQGATLAATQAALMRFGVPPEADDPYTPADFLVRLSPEVIRAGSANRVREGYVLDGLDDVLNALAAGYSPQIGIRVYASFESEEVARTGRVPLPGPGESLLGGHALQVYAFDRARQIVTGPNSWGPGWGDQGRYHLPFAYLQRPGLLMEARAYIV